MGLTGQTPAIYFYFCDGPGSVVALSHISGQIVEGYTDDVFGKVAIQCDAGPDGIWLNGDSQTAYGTSGSAYQNPYMFTGRRLDPETRNSSQARDGLYDYRARMYSPALGRFLQTDPIGYVDGMNLYAYVNNNPVNWMDPYGYNTTEVAREIATSPTSTVIVLSGAYYTIGELVLPVAGAVVVGAGVGYGIYELGVSPALDHLDQHIGRSSGPTTATEIAKKKEQIEHAKKERARKAARKEAKQGKKEHTTNNDPEGHSAAASHSSRKRYYNRLKDQGLLTVSPVGIVFFPDDNDSIEQKK